MAPRQAVTIRVDGLGFQLALQQRQRGRTPRGKLRAPAQAAVTFPWLLHGEVTCASHGLVITAQRTLAFCYHFI